VTPDQVAAEVRRLEITTRQLVRDLVAGEYASAFRGHGLEFAEVREYLPGDDIRTIDWKVTARLGNAYVKRQHEERELGVLLVVDASASGMFGSRVRTKRELAIEVAAVLGLAAARSNDRVGLALFTNRVERYVPPAKGRRQALRLMSELLAFEPAGHGTDLAGSLRFLEPLLRRRSVLFVVSDFLAEGWHDPFARLSRQHDVIAIQIVDPRERTLPKAGLITLRDPESGAWRVVDTASSIVRERFHSRMAEWDRTFERGLRERGADLIRLETARPYAESLITFFRRRERRQGK
jgi:uncharacterized protein (DUF58 family)